MEKELKKTPFNRIHRGLDAKLIGFAGWEMPVQYSGVIDEHLCIRSNVGVFDVSHMGRIEISGKEAAFFIQRLATNDITKITAGQAQYSLLCYPDGGIVDDILVYKIDDRRFLLCVNASNREKDLDWIKENNRGQADVADRSEELCQLAVQGQNTEKVLQKLCDTELSSIKYFWFKTGRIDGVEAVLSRTGYTGEDGFEIYFSPAEAERIWNAVFDAGKEYGIKPAGLGARDTLRLEMKYPLYGNDIDANTTPFEAGLDWAVKLNKGDFIGKEVLVKQKEDGIEKRLVGFEAIERGIPRAGYPLYDRDKNIGVVTSGVMSPSLKKPIGTGYVPKDYSKTDTVFDVVIREKRIKAKVVPTPFYQKR